MARKARAEVEGGLYHVITRGNNRRQIFSVANDYEKFLALLAAQKTKVPFFLYAYCLMSNHVHLLIERQADAVGRIMHWLLTGYAQYYNHRYRRVGSIAGYTGKYTTSRSHARDKIKSAAGKDRDRGPGGDSRRQQSVIT